MSKARLRAQLNRIRAMESPPPSFASVIATRAQRRGRLRLGRAAAAACCILGAAVFMLVARPDRPPDVATLASPPTTDWLLRTPSAHLMTQTPHHPPDKERPDGT
jgi:hypothetical protein